MKRNIMIAAVIAGLALTGLNQAQAGWGRGGYGAGYGGGYCGACPQFQPGQAGPVDPAVQEKLDAFFADTQDLRKQIAMKRAEQQAMMRSETPDPAALSRITGELFDLRTAMRAKAEESGVSSYIGPRGGSGFGPGMRGPGRGGRGMGGPMMGGSGFGGPRF